MGARDDTLSQLAAEMLARLERLKAGNIRHFRAKNMDFPGGNATIPGRFREVAHALAAASLLPIRQTPSQPWARLG